MQSGLVPNLDHDSVFQRPRQIVDRTKKFKAGLLVFKVKINPFIFADSKISQFANDNRAGVRKFQGLIKCRNKIADTKNRLLADVSFHEFAVDLTLCGKSNSRPEAEGPCSAPGT